MFELVGVHGQVVSCDESVYIGHRLARVGVRKVDARDEEREEFNNGVFW